MRGGAQLFALVLGLAAVGATGCKEYRYFDVHVRFDIASGFTNTNVSTVQYCHVYVTGADTTDFLLRENCSADDPALNVDIGTFEFSTHADSGQLTFTMKAYNGFTETDNCLFGQGSQTYMVTGETTQLDDPGPEDDLLINMMTPGCP